MNYRNILGKVICWTGGRGSGKTFSLAFECLRDMINGLTCWSNVPVIADIEVSPDDIRHYETLPLDIDSLRVFDKDMSNGTIAIDEINLWADSLSTLAVGNKLISAVFQLLTRKRGLAFRLTVQNFKWLTNRIRWQTDLVIACSDMCYLYHELEPGECISQSIVDMSGVFSGHPFEDREDNTQNYRQQIFHCKPFRGIYDTNLEFDYFEAHQPLKIATKAKIIRYGEVENAITNIDLNSNVSQLIEAISDTGVNSIPAEELWHMASDFGIKNDTRYIGRELKKLGVRYHQTKKGNFYELPV